MAVATLHVLHGINTPTIFYSEISNARIATGTSILTALPGGTLYPSFRSVLMQQPVVEFTTLDIKNAIDEFTIVGSGRAAGNNVDVYEVAVASLGTRTSGVSSAHNRFRLNSSFGFISRISAGHQTPATADVTIIPVYDGTTEPIVPAGSQALAGTAAAASYWVAGPVTINGTAFPGVQSIEVDFAFDVIRAGGESELWDSFVAMGQTVPVVTITAIDGTAFPDLGLDGTAISSTTKFYLRHKLIDGSNVGNATETHISFTINGGIVVPEQNAVGANNSPSISTYRIYTRGTLGGGYVPITVDTTAAIT